MTLKGTRTRLALLGVTALAMLGAVALSGIVGPLTGFPGVGSASAAPPAQGTALPEVSVTTSEVTVRESETATIEVSLSPAATSELVVGYTVSWPAGRAGDEQGTVRFAVGDSTKTATVTVPDDDVVGLKARDVLIFTLDQPDSDSGYALGAGGTKNVIVLEGVCDRSEKVQERILAAVTTATECHQVTDSDLSDARDLTGNLFWGNRKLIPSQASSPALKAGDFRGMSGVTELYLGNNELDRLPAGVFDGLSNLRVLYAANNRIKSLEPGVFVGLGRLTELGLGGNPVVGKFVLKPQLKRVDDDSFVVEIVEGAPSNVTVALSAPGVTPAAQSVTVPAGTTTSPQVTLSRDQAGSTVGVSITGASFASDKFYGIDLADGDTLNLPRPTVSVSAVSADVEATEGSLARVQLSISPAPVVTFTVEYELLDDDDDPSTVNGDSDDHGPVVPVEIPAGATSGSVSVEITDDADIDDGAREVLVFQLKDVGDAGDYVLGTDISATITIKEGICDRTDAVQLALLDGLENASGYCAEVTDAELDEFPGSLHLSGDIRLHDGGIVASLQSRDFMGLSSLTGLYLANATIVSLPPDVFDGLDSLTTLSLRDSRLASLDAGVFSDLSRLETLRLDNNRLTVLPDGLFSGLENLATLRVADNDLATLPSGVFVGLDSLSVIDFSGNDGAPFVLTAELAEGDPLAGSGGFGVKVLMADGSPGPVDVHLAASGAVLPNIPVTMDSGDAESVVTPFHWTGDATICIEGKTEDSEAFESRAVTLEGLNFGAGPCLTVPAPGPRLEITDAQVSQIEGQKAWISFVLSSGAPASFDLRYTTRPDGIEGTDDADKDVDYKATGEWEVTKGETRGSFSIDIVNDTEIDAGIHEVFVVELSHPVDGEPYYIGSTNAIATVTIKDGICDRAQIVQDAINGRLTDPPACHDVTKADLNGIQGTLTLSPASAPVQLQAREFLGLSNLSKLEMSTVDLSLGLPLDLFDGLDSVISLNMCFSNISSLNAGVFKGLDSITHLFMDNNPMDSLPADLFSDVPTLKHVRLYSNGFTSLDGSVFRGATALSIVRLNDNKLSGLPAGLFAGLTNLSELKLHGNTVDPFVLTASLTDEGDGSFAVQIAEGAPFAVSVPFTVTGGTASVTSVLVPAGALVSDSVKVTRDQGNTGNVTVTPSTPTWDGGSTVTTNLTGVSLAAGTALELTPSAN